MFTAHTVAEARDIIARVAKAQGAWRVRLIAERATFMRRIAGVLRANRDEYIRLTTSEMGKKGRHRRRRRDREVRLCGRAIRRPCRSYLAPEPVALTDRPGVGETEKAYIT